MKHKSFIISALIVLLLSFAALATLAQEGDKPEPASLEEQVVVPNSMLANVSSAFTYQGYLEQNGAPVNGTCDFQTNLYDAVTGGALLGFDLVLNSVVSNGRFTLALNDQGEFAANAFNGQGRWLEIIVRCPAGSGGYTTLTPRQPLYAAPYAHSLRPGAIIDGTTGADVGVLNLTGSTDALRVTATTGDGLTVESAGDAALEIITSHDGVRVINANDDGIEIVHAGGTGVWVAESGGHGVFASTTNANSYGGYFLNDASQTSFGEGLYTRSNRGTAADLILGGQASPCGSEADYTCDDGILRSDPAYAGSDILVKSNDAVVVQLDVDGDQSGGAFRVDLMDGSGNATQLLNVNNDGITTVQVLEITGGADLSEQFDVSSRQHVKPAPGLVVCIDAKNPGKLIICEHANDRTVAGVISGAGGIQPGMLMGQDGSAADGQHPVALTGRVYVWADASAGAIQPGDLLTTSHLPGFAARVNDHTSAQGAILGKAMTALVAEQGLVLVLVALQ